VRVAIIAGEASGDLIGAGLLRALIALHPGLRATGIAGPRMQAAGCESLFPMERLSVIGLFETFGRYPELILARARLIDRFVAERPDVFIGVDAPDFNLYVAHRLHEAGIKTVHYVSPSVWAWRRYRMKKIARAVDLMMVLFPFEAEFYRVRGLPVSFVGHPLADEIPAATDRSACRRSLGLAVEGQYVALLPGSRATEVRHLTPCMLETARWLSARRPGLAFLVPFANPSARACFESSSGRIDDLRIHRFDANARLVMGAADVVLLASGTASLEAMLLKRPMVITYRTGALSYAILKRWVGANIRHVGLPNLLGGRELVPELLQGQAVAEKLGPAVLRYLREPETVAALEREFERLHGELKRDASARAARAISDLLGGAAA
jgi:lipid-A-disaccharide synthase